MQPAESFTILVVDDEPPIHDILSRIAQKAFPEAAFVNTRSAQETLDYVEEQPDGVPQLVLLDIDLKSSADGLDLLPQLTTHFGGRVPIIMFSALGDELTIGKAYDQGAVAYTTKPQDLAGWNHYVTLIREYWYMMNQLPTIDADRKPRPDGE